MDYSLQSFTELGLVVREENANFLHFSFSFYRSLAYLRAIALVDSFDK